ncbi:MarR family winged helix-turn-helix transcriptional regulator [Ciceribacter azotifigens]|uniref:MarR family winged helix-turn-helix transcriptional regulator n=1 Tax=Ciceribacter azotifigens TaxID=2069303 RepID=UPI003A84FBE6
MSKESDLWLRLVHEIASVEADLERIMQVRHGLGLSEYRALQILSRSPGSELRMQALAAHLRLNQSSVSRMVERLERAGLAIRDLCPDDKRGVYAVLSDRGRACVEDAERGYEAALREALKKHRCGGLLAARQAELSNAET